MTRKLLEELCNLAQQNGDGIYGNLQIALADVDEILSATDLSTKHGVIYKTYPLIVAGASSFYPLLIKLSKR